jgi:hypothetical protein
VKFELLLETLTTPSDRGTAAIMTTTAPYHVPVPAGAYAGPDAGSRVPAPEAVHQRTGSGSGGRR